MSSTTSVNVVADPVDVYWWWAFWMGAVYIISWFIVYEGWSIQQKKMMAPPAAVPAYRFQMYTNTTLPSTAIPSALTVSPPLHWWQTTPFIVFAMFMYGMFLYGIVMFKYLDAITQLTDSSMRSKYSNVYNYDTKEFTSMYHRITYGWGIFSMIVAVIVAICIGVRFGPRMFG